jgi:integrase
VKVSKGTVFKKKGSPFLYINISINKKRELINTNFPHDKIDYVRNVELPLFRAKILSGEIVLNDDTKDIKTFKYYSDVLLQTKKYLKNSTLKRYEFYLDRFNSTFSNIPIKDIKASDLKKYLYDMDIKPLTFRNYLNLFKLVFDEALLDDEISINPCSKIKVPKNQKEDIEPFSKDEVNLILNSSTGFFKNFLAFAFYTGCRLGELYALKWQNIDLKKKRIYINATRNEHYGENTPKTGKNRYVPIFDSLIPYIMSQKADTGFKTYVFYSERGKLLHGDNLSKYHWKPLLKRLKLSYRVLYNTRHTFVTNMLTNSNFSLNQIAYWLGHSNIRTLTVHYNKYISSDLDNYDTKFDVFCNKNCNNLYVSA